MYHHINHQMLVIRAKKKVMGVYTMRVIVQRAQHSSRYFLCVNRVLPMTHFGWIDNSFVDKCNAVVVSYSVIENIQLGHDACLVG